MMAAFYRSLEATQENKELRGKIGMKVIQLEDSTDQEVRFLDFVKDRSINDFF